MCSALRVIWFSVFSAIAQYNNQVAFGLQELSPALYGHTPVRQARYRPMINPQGMIFFLGELQHADYSFLVSYNMKGLRVGPDAMQFVRE
jgi:hypothetical protein